MSEGLRCELKDSRCVHCGRYGDELAVCGGRLIITVEQIYGERLPELRAPQGWGFTGEFRQPLKGEAYLSSDCGTQTIASADSRFYPPVLILEKHQPRRRIVFEEDAAGEWVEYNGCFREGLALGLGVSVTPRYRRREEVI